MDTIHENSIHAISAIQQRFTDHKDYMFFISNLFDPRYAFLIFSPLVFSLDRATGRKLMWVTVLAEWSNQILKWLMRGERPYWWVHEFTSNSPAGATNQLPPIEQTFMTCETGPGSPSGHAMVTAAVWYILVAAFLRNCKFANFVGSKKNIFDTACWAIYTFVLCCVSLSRIYLAAHFPHQCLLGMGMGVAVAMMVDNLDTERVSKRAYILGTLGMFASAMLTYATLLYVFGFNPLWSVERALKWCAKREHVHLDTTPFFSMMRYIGFFLGMGLGLHSHLHKRLVNITSSLTHKLVTAAASIGVSRVIEKIPIPSDLLHVNAIYAIVFIESLVLPYLFVAVIPAMIHKVWPGKTRKTSNSSIPKAIRRQDSNNNSLNNGNHAKVH